MPIASEKLQKAIAKSDQQAAKIGQTVKLRAIKRGYYGKPLADLIEPGTEFKFVVSDLAPFKVGAEHADGAKVRSITIGKQAYALPSWCEDAKDPSSLMIDEDDIGQPIDQPGSQNDDVI